MNLLTPNEQTIQDIVSHETWPYWKPRPKVLPNEGKNYFFSHGRRMQENGYRIIPIKPGDKYPAKCIMPIDGKGHVRWVGLKDWQLIEEIKPEMAAAWPESSVGIVTGRGDGPIALDIDCMDVDAVEIIRNLAVSRLGNTRLIRQGQYPKIAMIYHGQDPFGKMKSGKVEVLAWGQQFVAFGMHPATGKPYQWLSLGHDPTNTSIDEVPTVCEDQLREFLDELSRNQVLIQKGAVETVQRQANLAGWTKSMTDKTRVVGSPEAVASAVRAIPNTELNWDKFKRIGMLIFAASLGADWGKDIFAEWAFRLPLSIRYDSPLDAWEDIRRSPPTRSGGANSIYAMARFDHGWLGEWEFPNEPNLDHIMDGFGNKQTPEKTPTPGRFS